MKLKNPSPKVLAFMLIVVVLTTITILSSKFIKTEKTTKDLPVNLSVKNNLNEKLDPKDTDGDSLADWQEEIWGTDKNNVDSDRDGTSDGEEVNKNRNPKKPGPDDKILTKRELADAYVPKETDPNSLTTILSKNLLLRLAQLEQSGQYTPETGENLANDLVRQSLEQVQIPEKYPENIFLTFDSKSIEDLEKYGDELFNAQYEEFYEIASNKSGELDPIIKSYKDIATRLVSISVPKEILKTHAKITNNYYIMAEALINLKVSDKDPVLGVLSIPIYKKASEEQDILGKQVQKYLEINGIIFNVKQ